MPGHWQQPRLVALFLVLGATCGFRAPHARPHATGRASVIRPVTTTVVEDAEATGSGVEKVNEASKKMGGPLSAVTDSFSAVAFSLLHAFDDCGVQDAAKNLRVLWTRALLANSGVLEDDVAYDLLPPSTRGVVSPQMVGLWEGLLPFCDWIKARTEYLDSILDVFLGARTDAAEEPYQVVVIGAGYDTRSLRRHDAERVRFFEVDLPEVVEGKSRLYKKYTAEKPGGDAIQLPVLVGMDLSTCKKPGTLAGELEKAGLKRGVRTLFMFEAVLFYLEKDEVEGLFGDIFSYAEDNGEGAGEVVISFTDSLKGLGVTKPFMPEVAPVFQERGFQLLTHRAQWGGAVHFTSAVSVPKTDTGTQSGALTLRDQMVEALGRPTNSYAPQYNLHSGKLMREPSFRKSWYAVAFSPAISTDGEPYATRLWGEPLVLFRDEDGNIVCLRDVCPHRAAPLSMGEVIDGQLKCFYHGWAFGKEGKCLDVPTMPGVTVDNKFLSRSCATNYAAVEHEGMIWVWGGETLEADPRLLPTQRPGEVTLYVDTTLDYNVDWSYIVENNLDSPHIYWLHDGSIPPLESLGFNRDNVDRFSLRRFKDEIGVGHVGKTADKSTTKIVRFDAPNVVRHCGVSGFSEEFHIIPIAPHRTRVLIRQHFPKGPILATVSRDPFLLGAFTLLMRWWNYNIALEDYSVMQGQSHNIEDLGAPHLLRPGLGDDLISEFYTWRNDAIAREGNPYFATWGAGPTTPQTDETGATAAKRTWAPNANDIPSDSYAVQDDRTEDGTWGLKRSYFQMSPAPTEPPVNAAGFRRVQTALNAAQTAGQGALALGAFALCFSLSSAVLPPQAVATEPGTPPLEALVTMVQGAVTSLFFS